MSNVVSDRLCAKELCQKIAKEDSEFCNRHDLRYRHCRMENCDNWAFHGGYCVKHGGRDWRSKCKISGCNTLIWKMGVCYKHRIKGHPRVRQFEVKEKLRCKWKGCKKPVSFDDLCVKHGREKGLQCHQQISNGSSTRRCRRRVEDGSKRCKKCSEL